MTSLEPGTPHSVDHDILDTEVIVVSSPAPVFVDSTGRRRRLLRRLSYVFGGLCMVYGGLVSVSLAGGPVSSSVVLPLPDLRDDTAEVAAPRPAPIPAPSTSARPAQLSIADVAPRRRAAADVNRVAGPRPPAAPAPTSAKPSPSAAPTSAKPVESAPVPSAPAPSATAATTPVPDLPTRTPVNIPPAPPPAPPAPPAPPSSGGAGGGGQVDDAEFEVEPVSQPVDEPGTEPAGTPEQPVAAEGTA